MWVLHRHGCSSIPHPKSTPLKQELRLSATGVFSNYRGYLNHLEDLLKYNSGPHPQSCQHSRSGAGLRIYIANTFPDDEDFASPGTTLGESLNNSKPHKWIRSLHCSPPWPACLRVQQHLMLGAICVQAGSLHHPRAVLTADILRPRYIRSR